MLMSCTTMRSTNLAKTAQSLTQMFLSLTHRHSVGEDAASRYMRHTRRALSSS